MNIFGRKKYSKLEFSALEYEKYFEILDRIYKILNLAGLNGQALVIQKLIDYLSEKNLGEFGKLINSVDMWGGSGAVWEVWIENREEMKKFELEVIDLIDHMEDSRILGRGIKPIRRIFEKSNFE